MVASSFQSMAGGVVDAGAEMLLAMVLGFCHFPPFLFRPSPLAHRLRRLGSIENVEGVRGRSGDEMARFDNGRANDIEGSTDT